MACSIGWRCFRNGSRARSWEREVRARLAFTPIVFSVNTSPLQSVRLMRVVVAEKVAETGLSLLREAGHEVVDLAGAPREQLLKALGDVDVPKATARGVLVINAPTANVVSATEHTFALLFAFLRRVPAASASMAGGKWEKSKFLGSELAGKTLGIIGLGQVGSRVAARARAFEAKVVAFDPFLPAEKAKEMGVPLLDLPELLATSDIVANYAPATDKGQPLIGAGELAHMKKGAILVNVARGS